MTINVENIFLPFFPPRPSDIKQVVEFYLLSSKMRIQDQYAPEFHNDFGQKKFYFYFSRIISQELIIASLFIIKAILNPFSATFHESCAGNISASFSM